VDLMRVLDADQDLGRLLDERAFGEARDRLVVPVVHLTRGPFSPWVVISRGRPPPLGILVVDGLIAQRVRLRDKAGVTLVGPGDVFAPSDYHTDTVGVAETWTILEGVCMAILDWDFERAAIGVPGVISGVVARVGRTSRGLALQRALSQIPYLSTRLLLFLWFVGDRWGKVGAVGVTIPLRLSHSLLAELLGARRSSVTLAVGELERHGRVSRARGRFTLHGSPPEEITTGAQSGAAWPGADKALQTAGWIPRSA
jgi:CRP/FNR family cyclic AMP-dependent transcriptional regulator